MKRFLAVLAVIVIATVAYAAPDVEPVRSWYQQYQYKVPEHFEKELNAAFIDAGTIKATTLVPTTINATTENTAALDAGAVYIRGNAQIAGTWQAGTKVDLLDAGTAHFNGRVTIVESVSVGKCTLNGASPSVCTDTVVAGSHCVCTNVGGTAAIAALGVACDVSSTTLTATSANGATHVVNWHCF